MAKYQDATIGQTEAAINRMGGFDNWLRFVSGQGEVVFKTFLDAIGTLKLPALPRFVARDHFKVNTSDSAEIKICGFYGGFSRFLDKVEEPVAETTIAVRKLSKDMLDSEIRAELGENKEEITLSQFHFMLKKQGHGQKGKLLTNGYANIFYIRDVEGTLWAVYAYWSAVDGAWLVDAFSVSDPYGWRAGYRVFSRNSVLGSSETSA